MLTAISMQVFSSSPLFFSKLGPELPADSPNPGGVQGKGRCST